MDRSSDNLGQTISNIQRDLEELKSNQGNGSGGGGGGGGEEYYAGNGIDIDQSNTISVDTSVVATQTDLASKQDTLTAGSHISISNNTISATGIPTKTSDLTNDSNFSSMEVVDSLPATGSDDTIYFVEASDLPTGYERLSYINIPFKSPTTAYVALENIWMTTNWKMEFDFEVAQCYDYCAIFGRIDDADQDREIWINSSSIYRWRAFGYTGSTDNSFFGETVATNKRYVVSHDNLGTSFVTTVNGNQTLSREKLTGTATSGMNFAFGHREGGGQLYGKIYGYKAWDGNGIVENLVPAKRTSDDALGFYDMANGTFKAMQGSGVSQLTGGDYNSYGYDTYIWDGSAYQQVGERVYLTSQLVNDSGFLTSVSWNDVQNKPTFATVATTGDYDDLTNKPTIPAAQVNSDWNASSGVAEILNKPNLATVATSGSYNDLSNKPTIPTVNNATLTIQKNGTTVQTFTANQSTAATANITVPTKTSDIINDSGFATFSADDICGEGKNILLPAPSNAPIASSRLDGETSQNGTPTPAAPIPVHTVTGENIVKIEGKNLLDLESNLVASSDGLTFSYSNGKLTVTGTPSPNTYANVTSKINTLIPAGEYTLSISDTVNHRIYLWIQYTDGTAASTFIIDAGKTSKTITTTKDIEQIRLDFSVLTLGTALDETFSIQLEAGSASSIDPYQKQSYEINLGKNLLDMTTLVPGYVNGSNGSITNYQTMGEMCSGFIKVEPSSIYTVSIAETTSTFAPWFGIGEYTAADTSAFVRRQANTSTPTSYTITTHNTTQYVRVSGRNFADATKIQFEKWPSPTDYAAYFEPIELCKIGDYQDYIYKSGSKWYKHKAVGKVIFDGTENWGREAPSYVRYYSEISDARNVGWRTEIYSDFFNYVSSGGSEGAGFLHTAKAYLYYGTSSQTTDNFKAWLGLNKPSFYYVIETAVEEEITNTALASQLDALLGSRSYSGVNHIFTVTTNEQGTLEVCFKGGIASPTLMAGCSATTNGLPGLVPAPSAGDQEKYLRGDGTWQPAGSSSDIPDGSITTAKLADSAVTTIKISDSNVTTAKIADSNVTTAKLADGAVTAAKLDSAIDSYSETEVATPYKFIDGHTIYKKTIHVTSITAREATYQHSISNLDIPVKIEGMLRDTNYGWQPLTRVLPAAMTGWGCGLGDLNGSTFKLFIGTSYTLSALSAYVTIYYTKY